ncbi:unnamed protein product [Dracunculus medinensis]|uniref:PET100 cytochrome c oxidase chaperone n=1 Tax=Dracunculus medinensis TaxID=318479 RepID=A0A0N4UKM7_DRAME|nr:unnamed protein product [Dracunculus medinensis]
MGGWKLEVGRFVGLVSFPVFCFWLFNQPDIFKQKSEFEKRSELVLSTFKESIKEERRQLEYEKFLREQMELEKIKREKK